MVRFMGLNTPRARKYKNASYMCMHVCMLQLDQNEVASSRRDGPDACVLGMFFRFTGFECTYAGQQELYSTIHWPSSHEHAPSKAKIIPEFFDFGHHLLQGCPGGVPVRNLTHGFRLHGYGSGFR